MKYYVYFDAYGHARQIVTEQQLAEDFNNETDKFLAAACRAQPDAERAHRTGHVGTLTFDSRKDLEDYLAGLGEEIEGFYECRSESRPYNF
jgi:hypothetical protein